MLDHSMFRTVLGRLASGVSVVTTMGPRQGTDQGPQRCDHGMTVTTVTSVSLEPPLILVCIDHAATMYPPMLIASHFAISILALEQEVLSRRFAESGGEKFDGIAYTRGVTGCALITGALAHLECAMWAQYEGGDHTIFVGHVLRAAVGAAQPLLYYRGGYSRLAP